VQSGALSKPDQHGQAEAADFAIPDLGYSGLSDPEAFGRFSLCESGPFQPLVDSGQQTGPHLKLNSFVGREEIVEYGFRHHGHLI